MGQPGPSFSLRRAREGYLAGFAERRAQLLQATEALAAGEEGADQDLHRQLARLAGSGGSHGVDVVTSWARELEAALRQPAASSPQVRAELVLSSLPSLDSQVAAAASSTEDLEVQPSPSAREERATVLLVDDDPDMRLLVESLLAIAGCHAVAVKTARAARSALRDVKPALILLDLLLADGDGRELFHELRADGRLAFVPILFFSSRAAPGDVAEGFRLGADDYITKPIHPETFLARVMARLNRARAVAETAVRDPLTGLYNRRNTDDLLLRAIANARRRQEPLAVALCDLDDFKRWNDTLGHRGGDEILRRFAAALTGGVRLVDTACRWGGEEFLVVLPRCDVSGATKVMARVRTLFSQAQGKAEAVTFSAGLADLRPDDDPLRLIARADANLYRAKAEGKDRAVG